MQTMQAPHSAIDVKVARSRNERAKLLSMLCAWLISDGSGSLFIAERLQLRKSLSSVDRHGLCVQLDAVQHPERVTSDALHRSNLLLGSEQIRWNLTMKTSILFPMVGHKTTLVALLVIQLTGLSWATEIHMCDNVQTIGELCRRWEKNLVSS